MSIATRTGDDGTTSLLYGRRVPKAHPRVAAYGTADELNAALGFARVTATDPWERETLLATQHELIGVMGELAVDDLDRDRYLASKLARLEDAHLARLDAAVAALEARNISFKGWATPGASLHGAALEMARTICRRAERGLVVLGETGAVLNPLALRYLNRLSDVLWLLARLDEATVGKR
ncbi:MAG TPA: cob(I)yrinic acid a,c-diamide adenosyltransferase [Opitutaceae bacterium]